MRTTLGDDNATARAAEALRQQRARFDRRTAEFAAAGFDRLGAPQFIIDQASGLGGPVLDVGTGTGITARALAGRGFDVVTVDSSAEDQEVAAFLTDDPDLARRVTYHVGDAAQLPYPDGHFGGAVAIDVLHHLEDGAAVLREVVRVVKPGGLVLLADFSGEGFAIVSRVHAGEGRVHPEGPVTMDWARGFLSAVGAEECPAADGHLHRVSVFRTPDTPGVSRAYAGMSRAQLLSALDVFAKNWLAHDGCWFLAAEERYGQDVAIELDTESWRRFAAAEARRIMGAFDIAPGGGLDALARALAYRMYSFINPCRIERSADGGVLRFFMESCRVQDTRRKKGLPDFPCRPVGQVEFDTFARAVDARIITSCLHCPPDADAGGRCGWEFTIAGAR
jgi:ubiquinone/menaquinone biosynthesis C-methylase UbiE